MLSAKLIGATALAIVAACGVASAQGTPAGTDLPDGRIYAFHSNAKNGCRALDWHIVVGANNTLSGMISWDDMKSVAVASGSANPAKRTFHLNAKRAGASGATIDGRIRDDGWLLANIKGPNVDCRGLAVQWFVPSQGAGNGG
jgi:hypothetical protein